MMPISISTTLKLPSKIVPSTRLSHVGSSQVLGFVQSNIFGESFSPSMIGSAPLFGTVGTLAHDVVDTLAPVTTAVQPVLTSVSDTVGTLAHDVVDTLAPVTTAVQPVLTSVSDTVGTLAHDVVDTLAPVEAAVQPVLTSVSDTVGTLTHDVVDTLAPVTTAVQPVLTSVSDTVGTLAHDVVDTLAPVTTAVQPVLTTVSDTVGTLAHDVADTLAPVTTAVQPVLTSVSDTVGTLAHDVAGNNASAVPDTSTGQAAGPADTLLALATSAAPIEAPVSATSTLANVVTDASNAAAVVHPTTLAADAIALNDAPPPPAHALFTGNQYTDYGVTLSTDIAVAPQHAVSQAESRIASGHFGARGRGCTKTCAAASRHRGYDSSNRSPWTCHPVAGVEHGGRRDTAQSAAQPFCGSASRRTGRRSPR